MGGGGGRGLGGGAAIQQTHLEPVHQYGGEYSVRDDVFIHCHMHWVLSSQICTAEQPDSAFTNLISNHGSWQTACKRLQNWCLSFNLQIGELSCHCWQLCYFVCNILTLSKIQERKISLVWLALIFLVQAPHWYSAWNMTNKMQEDEKSWPLGKIKTVNFYLSLSCVSVLLMGKMANFVLSLTCVSVPVMDKKLIRWQTFTFLCQVSVSCKMANFAFLCSVSQWYW